MSALKTEANAIVIGQTYVFNNVIAKENNVNAFVIDQQVVSDNVKKTKQR